MYTFFEKGTGAELNPKLPQETRKAFQDLLAKNGEGSALVASDFIEALRIEVINVANMNCRGLSETSGADYPAVQLPGHDVIPADPHSDAHCIVYDKPDALPSDMKLTLWQSLACGDHALSKEALEDARVVLGLGVYQVNLPSGIKSSSVGIKLHILG
ncbi:MAG: hypothetical protein PHD48_06045 [Alphaproteobacteria bacterium]|nr:hypothetical protein [Alphaproteobacteria bacterium]